MKHIILCLLLCSITGIDATHKRKLGPHPDEKQKKILKYVLPTSTDSLEKAIKSAAEEGDFTAIQNLLYKNPLLAQMLQTKYQTDTKSHNDLIKSLIKNGIQKQNTADFSHNLASVLHTLYIPTQQRLSTIESEPDPIEQIGLWTTHVKNFSEKTITNATQVWNVCKNNQCFLRKYNLACTYKHHNLRYSFCLKNNTDFL